MTRAILEPPGELNNIFFYEEIDMVLLHVEANHPAFKADLNNILCNEGFTSEFKDLCTQDSKIIFSVDFLFKNDQKRKPMQVYFDQLKEFQEFLLKLE